MTNRGKEGQADRRRYIPEQGLHGPGVGKVAWGPRHCPASQLSLFTVPAAAQCVIQDTKTCSRLSQPQTQGLYMGKSAFQEPAWLLRSIPLSSGTGHAVSPTSPAKEGPTQLTGTFWVPVCPCQAGAKHFPRDRGRTDRRQGLCPSPAFLSTAEGVFLLPSSLCRAGFAEDGTGLPPPTESASWPRQLEEGVFY